MAITVKSVEVMRMFADGAATCKLRVQDGSAS